MNIYHCCTQKSGSQWIKQIFSDPLVQKGTGLKIYTPKKDFILSKKNREELPKRFPLNTFVSPLYVRYEDFLSIPKPDNYKIFFVIRDPQDLVISRYFSRKYFHPIYNEQQEKERKFLCNVSIEEGIQYFIETMAAKHKPQYFSMLPWQNSNDTSAIIICKYEDLIGKNQLDTFEKVFNHCCLEIHKRELMKLLDKYSFEKLSKGRKPSTEEPKLHYRKGIAGDWQNYFNNNHKNLFKKIAGQLLIGLGYEENNNW